MQDDLNLLILHIFKGTFSLDEIAFCICVGNARVISFVQNTTVTAYAFREIDWLITNQCEGTCEKFKCNNEK